MPIVNAYNDMDNTNDVKFSHRLYPNKQWSQQHCVYVITSMRPVHSAELNIAPVTSLAQPIRKQLSSKASIEWDSWEGASNAF